MKPYKEHLISTKSFGEKINPKHKPVFRGSAIFPVIYSKKIQTRILFMGYWMIKNNIKELGFLATLRDREGKIIQRIHDQINSPTPKEIYIENLLNESLHKNYKNFIGSIELEVFSSRDLVFPYPAFVVNYFNEYGSSAVHTTGRIYNDVEDLESNTLTVKEAGFDILPGVEYEPVIMFTNGNYKTENTSVEVELITTKKNTLKKSISLQAINPLETVILNFKDYLDIDSYLNGQMGTLKIKHNFKGFFPRFIAGNINKTTKSLAITHTFYDNSNNTAPDAYWENAHRDIAYDSAVFIPLFIENEWYTQLKIYPIYSPSEHKVDLDFFDISGTLLGSKDQFLLLSENNQEFTEIDFGTIIKELSIPKEKVKGALLKKTWNNKSKIPTRLKYGFNIGVKNAAYDMPTNICFGSQICNIKLLEKKSAFKWLPLLNQGHSIAVIQNASFVKSYSKVANIDVLFYKSHSDKKVKRTYTVPPNGQIRITIDEELKNFASDNEVIWTVIKSDNPFVNAWYFEFNKSGIMGGDHSF